MREPRTHNACPQGSGPSVLVGNLVHTVHNPYCYSCLSFLKINVIGNTYDLWRRPS